MANEMKQVGRWGDAGVSEQMIVKEDKVNIPSTTGGTVTRTLQRAGYLKNLRMFMQAHVDQTVGGSAPDKTPYGPLAGMIRRIRIEAAGRQPLFVMSGLGTTFYNEIQSKDGSVLAVPDFQSEHNISQASKLVEYTDATTGDTDYYLKFPLEYAFSLPVFVRGVAKELGLWLLQNRSVDLGVEIEWNNPIGSQGALDRNSAYSNQADLAGTAVVADTFMSIERELYTVPKNPEARPNESWAHQVIEYEEPISGGSFRFDIPSAGLLLRAMVVILDDSGDVVEYTDLNEISMVYGTNTSPIRRAGWGCVAEYLNDYGCMPPKGMVSLDFYKWGLETLKLAKDTESLANFRIEGKFDSTTSGKALIIVDTLQRVLRQQS